MLEDIPAPFRAECQSIYDQLDIDPKCIDVSADTYRTYLDRLGFMSQSALKLCATDPQLFNEVVTGITRRPLPSSNQVWGTNAESYLKRLGDMPDDLVIIPREVLNKDGHRKGAAWKEFAAAHEHVRLLTEGEYRVEYGHFSRALENVRRHEIANHLVVEAVESGEALWHKRFFWLECDYSDEPIEFKCELDLLSPRYICDVKSAADTRPEAFARQVWKFGYDVQAYLYSKVTNFDRQFVWVVFKNSPPYNVETYLASPAILDSGAQRCDAYIADYATRRRDNNWFATTHGKLHALSLPTWSQFEFEAYEG